MADTYLDILCFITTLFFAISFVDYLTITIDRSAPHLITQKLVDIVYINHLVTNEDHPILNIMGFRGITYSHNKNCFGSSC